MNNKGKWPAERVAKMGMLVAVSVVLVYLIRFPIFPAVSFLEYEPGDVPILIGGFAFGPVAGIIMTILVSILQGFTVSAHSGLYGILMHVIATSALVLVSSLVYKYNKTKKGGIIALIAGSLAMIGIMVPANMIITPIFMGVPLQAVIQLLPFIIGFNAVKAGINSLITFFLYKHISGFLHGKKTR